MLSSGYRLGRPDRRLRPGLTTKDPFADDQPYLTLPEVREEVGLFGDTSHDALLTDYVLAGMERIGQLCQQSLQPVRIIDRFPAGPMAAGLLGYHAVESLYAVWTDPLRCELSQRHAGAIDSVTARLEGEPSPVPLVEGTDWSLDDSVSPANVLIQSRSTWSRTHTNPIAVTYASGGLPGAPGASVPIAVDTVRQALRYYVSTMYEARGGGTLPMGWEHGLVAILGAAAPVPL